MKISPRLSGVLQTAALVVIIDVITVAAVIGIGIATDWPTPWHFGRNMLISMLVLWTIGYFGSRGGAGPAKLRLDIPRPRERSVAPVSAEQWQSLDTHDRVARTSFLWLMVIAGGGMFLIGLVVMAVFPPTPGVPTQ